MSDTPTKRLIHHRYPHTQKRAIAVRLGGELDSPQATVAVHATVDLGMTEFTVISLARKDGRIERSESGIIALAPLDIDDFDNVLGTVPSHEGGRRRRVRADLLKHLEATSSGCGAARRSALRRSSVRDTSGI